MNSATRADVIAVGGAEDKERDKEILWAFFNRAGGADAIITIVPAASGIPDVLGTLYRDLFASMGASLDNIKILDIRNPTEARNPAAIELLQQCTGLYFTGGDQERLAEVLVNTDSLALIQQRCFAGELVIAGTSAGASALGQQMISRGYSGESPTPAIVTVKVGLGILEDVIVDQHFHQRNRLLRLMTALAYHPHCLGIGIDENTAAIITKEGILEVIGAGVVTIVDARELKSNLHQVLSDQVFNLQNVKVHFLSPGSRFNIHTLEMV